MQAIWQLVPPKTVSYACQNNPANEIVANFFFWTRRRSALGADRTVTMWLVGAASAGKYGSERRPRASGQLPEGELARHQHRQDRRAPVPGEVKSPPKSDERQQERTRPGGAHPPSSVRPNTVRNIDAWYKAFEVRPGDKLYLAPADRVKLW